MILFYILLSALLTIAPKPSQDPCMSLLLSAWDNMSMLRSYQPGKAGSLQLEIVSYYKKPDNKTAQSKVNVSVLCDGQRTHSVSAESETWTDAKYAVSVDKRGKNILIADNLAAGANNPDYILRIQHIRDSLFSKLTMLSCQEEKLGQSGVFKHLTFKPSKNKPSSVTAAISSADFWVDPRTGQMQRFSILYKPGKLVERMTVEVKKVDHNAASSGLLTTAKQAVLDKNGKLLAAYQGYKLTDASKH